MNMTIKIDIDKYLNKLGISLKIKRYILILIILVIIIWLFLPPILGYYYFGPSTCLDGGKGTIILNGKKSLLCSIGGFSPKYMTKTVTMYRDSYVSDFTFKNEILTVFLRGEETAKFEVKNRFFWILWRDFAPWDGDDKWHFELPLYNPIAFFQTLAVKKRYLKEKGMIPSVGTK